MTDIEQLVAMLAEDELTFTTLVDGTGVILDVDSMQVFTLNRTGMFLVDAMAGGVADRNELAARLVASFEVDDATAAADVDTFVSELADFLLKSRRR